MNLGEHNESQGTFQSYQDTPPVFFPELICALLLLSPVIQFCTDTN